MRDDNGEGRYDQLEVSLSNSEKLQTMFALQQKRTGLGAKIPGL